MKQVHEYPDPGKKEIRKRKKRVGQCVRGCTSSTEPVPDQQGQTTGNGEWSGNATAYSIRWDRLVWFGKWQWQWQISTSVPPATLSTTDQRSSRSRAGGRGSKSLEN